MDEVTKQVIVIRRDLHMRRGKEIAQGAHASMAWLSRRVTSPGPVRYSSAEADWLFSRFTKIVCQVDSLEELMMAYHAAQASGLEAHLITDAGTTEFHGEPTPTAVAIGPDWASRIDPITKDLRLY